VVYTGAGVVSRINPSQILETAVAKVAEKSGKPIAVENYADRDNVKWAKDLLRKNKVTDKEDLFDPITGRKIKKVMVGPQFVLKMFKTTGTNYSARATGNYDSNEQPVKGGDSGSKALGIMEINALLSHNARNVLKEATTLKSQKNDEFWRAYQLGLPLPKLQRPFVFNKFQNLLNTAGIKATEDGANMSLGPLTDNDIGRMSNGAISKPTNIKSNLDPEKGGLFDPVITGGLRGTKWSHIDLAEPVVNPAFKDPVKRLLGKSTKELDAMIANEGGRGIRKELGKIDVSGRIKELETQLPSLPKSRIDNSVKQIKYLRALKRQNLHPAEAYVLSKVPVLPPIMRPIIPVKGGDLVVDDASKLYRDVMLTNDKLKELKTIGLSGEHIAPLRTELHQSVGAIAGTNDPVSPQLKNANVKGALRYLAGTTPKRGFFQEKVFARKQDLSGRGTAAPDPSLGMDEIGLPDKMARTLYRPFVMKRLISAGHKPIDAEKMIEDKHPITSKLIDLEMQERPVLINRAPTLHRFGMLSQFPKRIPGKTIRVQPSLMMPLAGDFDGDALQIHVPVTEKAVQESKKMLLSKMVLGDRTKNNILVKPSHEAVIGLYQASTAKSTGRKQTFKSFAAAQKAYQEGNVELGDEVEIK
jgi:DNA-directed RNA polymerase beta' subunit